MFVAVCLPTAYFACFVQKILVVWRIPGVGINHFKIIYDYYTSSVESSSFGS